jgi:hypothetical protein
LRVIFTTGAIGTCLAIPALLFRRTQPVNS